ncbi:aspartate:alanine exchanger family transporter [Geothrix sp. PMB-07]|uniref:aspartate:alanine exchanger family transporter n=1 Tax=Geothrix sp. PMB-07 TaxID=3068640 RepID=UPI00274167DD|nr:aspartate:alanine exchanger family transporter [Geothrix sp. PMB-07]WLT33198.1 aspartate:alanine exchanger family transporter [Geothrix sp. PMB-07]
MIEHVLFFFAHNPLLMLFAVVALGYPISKIRIAGASFGIASILFAGIALGALVMAPGLDPGLKKDISKEMKLVYELGLAVFVYAMGLSISHSFWAAFSREGMKKNAVVFLVMLASTGFVVLLAHLMGFNARYAAGLLTGSFTNMPALAGVIERVKTMTGVGPVELAQPTVASAIAYPIGVLVPMLIIMVSAKVFRVNLKEEADGLKDYQTGHQKLEVWTVRVTRPEAEALSKHDIRSPQNLHVVFGRVLRKAELLIPGTDFRLKVDDLVTVVGAPEDLQKVEALIGERSHVELDRDQSALDATRVFVSRWDVVGVPLRKLDLINQYGAIVTRVRRGDLWFVPDGDTVLELGDRVRVTTRRDNIEAIEEFFGDSYRDLSEVSFLTFAMGLAAGLALGQLPIPLSHGIIFKLGFAGGPLAAALVLGRFHRIGPLVWNFPYSANHTIRQFGLVLFAAGIGVISGEGFRAIVSKNASVLPLFMGAAFLVCFMADSLTMVLGYKVFRIPLNVMFGILAGTHTQPVVLGYANHQTGNELPNVGFATVYPLATILKIVLAQVLLALIT